MQWKIWIFRFSDLFDLFDFLICLSFRVFPDCSGFFVLFRNFNVFFYFSPRRGLRALHRTAPICKKNAPTRGRLGRGSFGPLGSCALGASTSEDVAIAGALGVAHPGKSQKEGQDDQGEIEEVE